MGFFHDVFDDDIVNEMTGRSRRKRVINLDDVRLFRSTKATDLPSSEPFPQQPRLTSSKKSKKSKKPKKSSSTKPGASAPRSWFGSRYGFISGMRPQRTHNSASLLDNPDEDAFERKFRYIQGEQLAAERDLEYGFARQYELDRVNRRKKAIVALLAGASSLREGPRMGLADAAPLPSVA